MSSKTTRLGLQLAQSRPTLSSSSHTVLPSRRTISSAVLFPSTRDRLRFSRLSPLAANPPSSTTPSSFFTPSLCRTRNASTSTASSTSPPSALDWNTFFRMRTVRRRYSLASSILTSLGSTGGALYTFSEFPDLADSITKVIPTDPIISIGIATLSSTLLGWLIGPAFGNAVWRLSHRTRLRDFNIKERGFFERVKKHRVNPSGASTNNPVPDFYGEKVGSVAGYRRWLKDQRAFNRKRGGNYPSTV
ncbi:TIM23 complex component [Cladophialophora chaetospira]|uniref:Presequence translocated-associated motor subunit PAM17 n=1 Tax=Cladophialophora chaetospira TaxID=386627 RepID=A0AA39CEG8_9EURO|nr:TIM23 complex component [Cladophialophora chaetospira]